MAKQQCKKKKIVPKRKALWTDEEYKILLSLRTSENIRAAFSSGKTIEGLERWDLQQCLRKFHRKIGNVTRGRNKPWTVEEDAILLSYGKRSNIKAFGRWNLKACQSRWCKIGNVTRGRNNWTVEEDAILLSYGKRSNIKAFRRRNLIACQSRWDYKVRIEKKLHPTVVKKCYVDGCRRKATDNGKCFAEHGGFNYCKMDKCKSRNWRKGLCQKHGAYGWCKFDGCKTALSFYTKNGFCIKHSPQRKCKNPDCDETITKNRGNEFCLMHHPGLQYCPEIEAVPRAAPIKAPSLPPLPDII